MNSTEKKAALAKNLQTLIKEKKRNQSEYLKLSHYLLESYGKAMNASTLTSKGSMPLFFALEAASISLEKEFSPAGLVGPNLAKLTDAFSDFLNNSFQKNEATGFKMLLKKTLQLLTIASVIVTQKLGQLNWTPKSKQEIDSDTFEFTLVVLVLLKSELLDTLFHQVNLACAMDEKTSKEALIFIKTYILGILLFSHAENHPKKMEKLFQDLNPFLSDFLQKNISFLTKFDDSSEFTLFLQEIYLSIENDNFDNFITSINEGLNKINVNSVNLINEMKEIKESVIITLGAKTEGPKYSAHASQSI